MSYPDRIKISSNMFAIKGVARSHTSYALAKHRNIEVDFLDFNIQVKKD